MECYTNFKTKFDNSQIATVSIDNPSIVAFLHIIALEGHFETIISSNMHIKN
jgi:hypothetical protein